MVTVLGGPTRVYPRGSTVNTRKHHPLRRSTTGRWSDIQRVWSSVMLIQHFPSWRSMTLTMRRQQTGGHSPLSLSFVRYVRFRTVGGDARCLRWCIVRRSFRADDSSSSIYFFFFLSSFVLFRKIYNLCKDKCLGVIPAWKIIVDLWSLGRNSWFVLIKTAFHLHLLLLFQNMWNECPRSRFLGFIQAWRVIEDLWSLERKIWFELIKTLFLLLNWFCTKIFITCVQGQSDYELFELKKL